MGVCALPGLEATGLLERLGQPPEAEHGLRVPSERRRIVGALLEQPLALGDHLVVAVCEHQVVQRHLKSRVDVRHLHSRRASWFARTRSHEETIAAPRAHLIGASRA